MSRRAGNGKRPAALPPPQHCPLFSLPALTFGGSGRCAKCCLLHYFGNELKIGCLLAVASHLGSCVMEMLKDIHYANHDVGAAAMGQGPAPQSVTWSVSLRHPGPSCHDLPWQLCVVHAGSAQVSGSRLCWGRSFQLAVGRNPAATLGMERHRKARQHVREWTESLLPCGVAWLLQHTRMGCLLAVVLLSLVYRLRLTALLM